MDKNLAGSIRAILEGTTVAASGTKTSELIPADAIRGNCSIQLTLSGSGTAKITYKASNRQNGDKLVAPGTNEIATNLTAGDHFLDFPSGHPLPCQWLALIFTETGGANDITIDECKLFIQ